jgi:hypothetical protein
MGRRAPPAGKSRLATSDPIDGREGGLVFRAYIFRWLHLPSAIRFISGIQRPLGRELLPRPGGCWLLSCGNHLRLPPATGEPEAAARRGASPLPVSRLDIRGTPSTSEPDGQFPPAGFRRFREPRFRRRVERAGRRWRGNPGAWPLIHVFLAVLACAIFL